MSDNVRSEAILIPEGALEEIGTTPEELAEAMRKEGGEIKHIPRRVTLTHNDLVSLMTGETIQRGGVEIVMRLPYEPDEPPATPDESIDPSHEPESQ